MPPCSCILSPLWTASYGEICPGGTAARLHLPLYHFFVEKKGGRFCSYIDYWWLNQIIVKYWYPLPLIPLALEQLHSAKIFKTWATSYLQSHLDQRGWQMEDGIYHYLWSLWVLHHAIWALLHTLSLLTAHQLCLNGHVRRTCDCIHWWHFD